MHAYYVYPNGMEQASPGDPTPPKSSLLFAYDLSQKPIWVEVLMWRYINLHWLMHTMSYMQITYGIYIYKYIHAKANMHMKA